MGKKILFILVFIFLSFVFFSCFPPTEIKVPTEVDATDGDYTNKIVITWKTVYGANGYKVYRSQSSSGGYALLGNSSTNKFEDNPEDLNTYYYVVTAYNSYVESAYSKSDSGYMSPAFPMPTGVSASDGAYRDRIYVIWNEVSGATGYRVYRSDSTTGVFGYIGSTIVASYSDYPTEMINYYYRVVAYSSEGYSEMSAYDSGYLKPILPPGSVAASDGVYRDKIVINWTNISDATGYRVFRSSLLNGSYSLLGSTSATSYEDFPDNLNVYYYKVKSYDSFGVSDYSTADSGYRKDIPAPTGVSASDGTHTDKIAITWSNVDDATGYKVYRSDTEAGSYTYLNSVSGLIYNDNTLTDTNIYYYKVRAFDTYGESTNYSNTDGGNYGPALPSPTNLSAGDGVYRDKIVVVWDSVAGATGYRVYRSTSSTGTFAFLETTTATTYDDDDYPGNTSIYYYKINAYSSSGYSHFSNIDAGSRKELAVPTLSATDGTYRDKIAITWNSIAEATSYKLYRSTSSTGTYSQIGSSLTSTSYDDIYNASTNPITTSPYFYKIKSFDAYGESVFSAYESGSRKVLDAPTNIAASDGNFRDRIEIAWDSVPDVVGYKLYRSTSSTGTYSQIGSNLTSTSYNDVYNASTNPITTAQYYYKVKAYDNYGDSDAFSNIDNGSRKVLDAPTNLAASDGTFRDRIEITWNSVPDVVGYKLYRSTSETGTYNVIQTLSGTSYNDMPADTLTYYYKVKAYDNYGDSDAFSNIDSGSRKALGIPSITSASDGDYRDRIVITWTSVTDATGYKLYRSTSSTGTYTQIGSTLSSTSYQDIYNASTNPITTGLYYYKVKASDSYGDSDFSSFNSGYRASLSYPFNVSATKGVYRDKVQIAWNSVSGATGYDVYRSNNSSSGYSKIGTTTNTTYNDTTLTNTYTYYYKVKTYDSYGDSDFSDYSSGYLKELSAPTGVSATDGVYPDKIRITWNNVTDGYGSITYRVYRSNYSSGYYSQIGSTSNTYYDEFTSSQDTYYYKVSAVDNIGEGLLSYDDSGYIAQLSAPTGVSASDGNYSNQIYISWYSVSGATGYRVYRSEYSNGTYDWLVNTSNTYYYDNYNLETYKTYYYKVKAYNSYGDSDFSDYDSGYISSQLSAPTGVSASDGTYSDKISVSWYSVSGVIGYHVYRSEYSNGTYNWLATTSSTYYDDNDYYLQANTTYYYKVKAYNSYADSDFSNYDSGYMSSGISASYIPVSPSWTDGYLSSGEEKWYYFNASYGSNYYIYWTDSDSNPGSGICDITVSAYRENLTTSYFTNEDGNHSTNPEQITAYGTERVYIKVTGFSSFDYGSFTIRVTNTLLKND